ncbi:hypothetical protein C0995_008016 [Termitomyces sp. Mi166|nr:hypothetical protein C0995_008016 [Termitomyces sp. Mi166\
MNQLFGNSNIESTIPCYRTILLQIMAIQYLVKTQNLYLNSDNILITSSGGILNDWDVEEKDILRSRRHERLGPWEFRSSLVLLGHHDAHTIQDDIESFVLIIIYHALRYLHHNKRKRILYILNSVFNGQARLHTEEYVGGVARKSLFLHTDYIGMDFRLSSTPLDQWLAHAIYAVKEWIETEIAKSSPKRPKMTIEEQLAYVAGTFRPSLPVETEPTFMPPRVLDDHESMVELLTACLEANDWPGLVDDKPCDVLPSLLAQEKQRALESRFGGYC